MEPLFNPYQFDATDRQRLDLDGHLVLPGILTDASCALLTAALSTIQAVAPADRQHANHYSAEVNAYLASLISHPQLLQLAREILGPIIRFDHCVSLIRPPGDGGSGWHSHAYAED